MFWKFKIIVRCYYNSISNMKYLNVAEKNDAAKTIAGLLSNGTAQRREGFSVYNKIYDFNATVKGKSTKMVMTSVSGHLLGFEFPAMYRNWRNIDPQLLFDAPVLKTCLDDFQPIKRTLEREIRGCQGLIIWTDCDREGENIGFEIIEVCRAINARIAVYRATFSEITATAVRRALQQLMQPDKRQSDAVDVRSELDLRTGAVITRYQTLRLQRLFPQNIADKLISYGSCQIPTLGFVVERYKEVEAFIQEPFWKIKVTHTIDELTVEFHWARNRLFDQSACEDYLLLCLADPTATVQSVKVKPKSKWRPQPMDTVEMEKLGSRKLKLSAKETMTIAEKLYTKGIISYPRTETNQFSKEINLGSLVEQQVQHAHWGAFAQRVIEWGPNPRNGSKSDQAHPPIHPLKLVTDLGGNEARVYELICRHFLACVSKDAIGSETIVDIDVAGEKFTATGLCIYERNYLDVYIYDRWNAKQIHKYEQDQTFEPTDISMAEGATTAPPLLTEADLIVLMEKNGIGTDATHAEHINTIKERGYIGVVEPGGFLVPGIIGMGLYEGYDAMELALSKPNLRAAFEQDLKQICLGNKQPELVLREHMQKYKEAYAQILDKINALDEKFALRINETPAQRGGDVDAGSDNVLTFAQELFQCPKCAAAPLVLRQTKKMAYYIGCLGYPACKNAIWLPAECAEPSVLSEACTQCGRKLLKLRLTTAYYKALLQAPHGWYKTCLHCDRQFRDAFNINVDAVKRSGAIVNVAAGNGPPPPGPPPAPATTTTSRPSAGSRAMKTKSAGVKTERSGTVAAPTSNIRSYFSDTSTTTSGDAAAASTETELFFDSNDDEFVSAILAAEAAATDGRASDVIHAAFADSNDDALLANLDFNDVDWTNDDDATDLTAWGSAGKRARRPSAGGADAAELVRCNVCGAPAKQFSVRRDGPNKGKRFYVCSMKSCQFFQWAADCTSAAPQATASNVTAATTAETTPTGYRTAADSSSNGVQCNCNFPASKRTVYKNGPNKGRSFFACSGHQGRACGYFKWAGDGDHSDQAPERPYNGAASTSRQAAAANRTDKENRRGPRKCGLCRKVGHTKLKCPRKDEFNY